MSCIVVCWVASRRTASPLEHWEGLEALEDLPPVPEVVAFVEEITARWPDDDDLDGTPWGDAPLINNASGEYVLANLVDGEYAACLPILASTASKHGLETFDFATGDLVDGGPSRARV